MHYAAAFSDCPMAFIDLFRTTEPLPIGFSDRLLLRLRSIGHPGAVNGPIALRK